MGHSQNSQYNINFAQMFLQYLDLRLKNIVPCEAYKTAVGSEFIKTKLMLEMKASNELAFSRDLKM